jgi:hypothetical protein
MGLDVEHGFRRARNGDAKETFIAYCWCGERFEAGSLEQAVAALNEHVGEVEDGSA